MSKYKAVRTNGYASKKEANHAADLHVLEKAGIICNLKEQVPFDLLPAAPELGYPKPLRYIADFVYVEPKKGVQVVDVKGFRTQVYKLKKRLLAQLRGVTITEL